MEQGGSSPLRKEGWEWGGEKWGPGVLGVQQGALGDWQLGRGGMRSMDHR